MNDREQLLLAAKAAGYEVFGTEHPADGLNILADGRVYLWRPREDDGDAFRLLADMPSLWTLALKFGAPSFDLSVAWGQGKGINVSEWATQGRCKREALRRAIFRAAAEIGRQMKTGER